MSGSNGGCKIELLQAKQVLKYPLERIYYAIYNFHRKALNFSFYKIFFSCFKITRDLFFLDPLGVSAGGYLRAHNGIRMYARRVYDSVAPCQVGGLVVVHLVG